MDSPVIQIDGCDTIPKLFRARVQSLQQKVAMREKEFGIWQSVSWEEYGNAALEIGMGLLSLGLAPKRACSILSENNKEWLFVDMGVISVDGIVSGVYPTDSAEQTVHLVVDSNSQFIFVENAEQLDKVISVREQMPSLEKIIIFDLEGLRNFKDDSVISLAELRKLGKAYHQKHPNLWNEKVDLTQPHDLFLLIYTSGTTGPPKGVMLSHQNILFIMKNSQDVAPQTQTDEQLCFLPLCHIAESLFSIHWPLQSSSTINFVESTDTVAHNLRELSPTVFLAVPRFWEKFYSSMMIQMKNATAFGKWAYEKAISIGYQYAKYKEEGKPIPIGIALLYQIASYTVLNNIKKLMGLDRLRWAITGAAPIAPELIRWYRALNIELHEVYGQSECSGLATANKPQESKVGSIGKTIPHTEVQISEQGEILIKGPHVFLGYLNQAEKTKETIINGWLHTGDVGEIDDQGYIRITDRMKDIIITAGGKNISPSEIENQLKFSSYISDAVVIGDQRKYLTCLIMIDYDNVYEFAQDQKLSFTNFASLSNLPEVNSLIWKEIEQVNQKLARVETIKKFRLIDQQLQAGDEELTATMKLKRKFVDKKYAKLIESMY